MKASDKITIELQGYHVANLRSLIESIGYPYSVDAIVSPLDEANTGDWLGEVYNMLPETSCSANKTPNELRERACGWFGSFLRASKIL